MHSTSKTRTLIKENVSAEYAQQPTKEIGVNVPLRDLHDFELALLEPCAAMTARGLRVDNDVRLRMIGDLDAVREPTTARLNEAVAPLLAQAPVDTTRLFAEKWTCKACRNGKIKRTTCAACNGVGQRVWLEFNPGSEKQQKIVLYNLLKLPKRLQDGKLTTSEDALKSLLSHDSSDVVRDLLAYAKADTMRSIFERLAPSADGRIRTWYNVAGTETGRFSSAETFLETASTNLQNLPLKQAARSPLYDVRRCIVPDAGEVFLYADLSQAEARVVAALSGDRELLDRWLDPDFDIHTWTASRIFGKEVGDVTKAERHLGKVARHALNYGMGWLTFQANVNADADITGVSVDAGTAKRVVASYHHLHPRLQDWWRRVGRLLDEKGQLATIFGRSRTFFGRRSADRYLDGTHKEAIAFEPQSTVADLLNRGLLRYWQQFDRATYVRGGDARVGQLQAQVHDAILVGCPPAHANQEAARITACLEEELDVNGVRLTIPCEVEVGRTNWAELEEVALAEAA